MGVIVQIVSMESGTVIIALVLLGGMVLLALRLCAHLLAYTVNVQTIQILVIVPIHGRMTYAIVTLEMKNF